MKVSKIVHFWQSSSNLKHGSDKNNISEEQVCSLLSRYIKVITLCGDSVSVKFFTVLLPMLMVRRELRVDFLKNNLPLYCPFQSICIIIQ